jgi:sugar phosphate isomerase/epimerase
MIRSSVTISLVPEARGGPFVFHGDLEAGCRQAAELGFDAVEVFAPSGAAVDSGRLGDQLKAHGLKLAAVGTGAGWILHRLTLTSADPERREQACAFVRGVIDLGGPIGAPAIIGSMQGRFGEDVSRDQALAHLTETLGSLGEYARRYSVPLLYEPLNRYETNLVNTLDDGVRLLKSLATDNVRLLADLFHMNIEEVDVAQALRAAGLHVGHVHLADSNRRPAGGGHTDFTPAAAALREIGYQGYVSAEAFPYPDSVEAARQTMTAFRRSFAT